MTLGDIDATGKRASTPLAREVLAMFVVMSLALDPLASAVAVAGPAGPTARPTLLPYVPAASSPTLVEPDANPKAALGERLAKLPLYFIENRGQVDGRVAYYVAGSDTSVYFGSDGVTYALTERLGSKTATENGPEPGDVAERHRWSLKLDFLDANRNVTPMGDEPTSAVVSYFKGPRESWRTGLPTYGGVVYRELWPGIDLAYGGAGGQLKYTFIVQPGADPSQIQLAYRGATAVELVEDGRLRVTTPVRSFDEERPYAYQETDGQQVRVEASYALQGVSTSDGHRFGFRLGSYDRAKPLILDPVQLVYCGYIGGGGFDQANGIAVDASGNAYVTGSTNSSASFPVVAGSWDTSLVVGTTDAFVAKINATGTALVYCGYIGGNGSDEGRSIAVDGTGNAYVTGVTTSTAGFPATAGFDTSFAGGSDAFVTKINATGTALVYSGYIGGVDVDYGQGIAVDDSNNAYVVGHTSSTNSGSPSTRFPVSPTWPQPTCHGGGTYDAFVAKIDDQGSSFVFSGCIGGTAHDQGRGIAVDASRNAYVVGYTASDDFPVVTGSWDTSRAIGTDAFVTKINAGGTGLVYSGYIGGDGIDEGRAVAVDGLGNAYVVGQTNSPEVSFPVVGGSWDTTYNTGDDAFVAKINAGGSALVYSGYIGGSGLDIGAGIAVDGAGSAYVTGETNSSEVTFPVVDGPDLGYNGGSSDAFVAKIGPGGTFLIYCGYIGGSATDVGVAIAVDGSGNAYVAGRTDSSEATFPDAVGPDASHNGGTDAFVAKIRLPLATAEPDIKFFTVTSTSERNVLEWVNPTTAAVPDYLSTQIVVKTGGSPANPGDGTTVVCDQPGAGQKVRCEHFTGPGSNDTTYYYAAFVHRTTPAVSPDCVRTGRPFDTTGPVKWSFNTGTETTSVAPPTVGEPGVLAPSNDGNLYAMKRGSGLFGGEWPDTWWPKDLGVTAVVQSRSPVVPITVDTADQVVFLGAHNGFVYAVDARHGGEGNRSVLWERFIGAEGGAAPAGIFRDFDADLPFDAYLLVGTRDVSVPNAFVALDRWGYVVDTFDNGGSGEAAKAIGLINGMAAVHYASGRVYFASRRRTGGTLATLWCLQLGSEFDALTECGSPFPLALEDIDSGPVIRGDRIYVGSNAATGTVYSIDATTGTFRSFEHRDGQVKGFIFPDRASSTGDLYFATDNYVWGLKDTGGVLANKFASRISLPGGAQPSSPVLFVPGSHYLYVGGSDGKIHEIDTSEGAGLPNPPVSNPVTLGDGLAGNIGAPSLDRGVLPKPLLHVGSLAGIFYAVETPFPPMCVASCTGQPDFVSCSCFAADPCTAQCIAGLCSDGGGC